MFGLHWLDKIAVTSLFTGGCWTPPQAPSKLRLWQ